MQSEEVAATRERVARAIRDLHPRLIEISHAIHANPELRFEERQAAALLAGELEGHGFVVDRGVAGLDTAFVASYGSGRPAVAFLAEYDALPKLGHACGHNLIAAWALGAGIALRRALPDLQGTIKVIGTPGEEGGGGKVIMAEAGVFRGLDAALMMHPRDATHLDRGSLAVSRYDIEFFGKAAHASSYPDRGISALDAVLQVFFSVNALRQLLKPDARIHGVITRGGDAPNIIPEYAAARFLVRAREQEYLEEVVRRFLNIVEAAGLATGARPQVARGVSYKARACTPALLEVLRGNMAALGIEPEPPPLDGGVGSSDVGDVSQLVPTVHPYLSICEKGIPTHSPQMTMAAVSPEADRLIAQGSILLAWTGAEVLMRPDVRARVASSFHQLLGRDPQQ